MRQPFFCLLAKSILGLRFFDQSKLQTAMMITASISLLRCQIMFPGSAIYITDGKVTSSMLSVCYLEKEIGNSPAEHLKY